jgi:hypothetical protein
MKYRKLGTNNDMVSVLGYGCMRLPVIDGNIGNIDEKLAIEQIRYGIDKGINYIDTAYPYHMGHSETVVGKALKNGYREKVFLADKLPTWLIKSNEDMYNYLDKQLEKLDTEYIDFYLIHTLDKMKWKRVLKNNLFEFIENSKAKGKIKQIGFSFHDDYELFEEIVDAYDWDFCQIQLNYMDEDYQAGLKGLAYAKNKDLDVIVMEPLKGGTLANNVPKDIDDIWKSVNSKRSAAGWALQYLWNYDGISTVLSGMNSYEQIDDNIKEACKSGIDSLSKKERETIEKVKEIYKSRILVNCTGCKYCMPCPHGVDIPGCFSSYNNANIYNNFDYYNNHYLIFMSDSEKAGRCIKCGVCEELCPQHLPIMDLLEKVRNKFGK